MLAAITSHITDDPNAVHLRRGDFADGGLPKASMVKMTKLFTMHSSRIVKPICVLRIEKKEEFLRSVRGFLRPWAGGDAPAGGIGKSAGGGDRRLEYIPRLPESL